MYKVPGKLLIKYNSLKILTLPGLFKRLLPCTVTFLEYKKLSFDVRDNFEIKFYPLAPNRVVLNWLMEQFENRNPFNKFAL